MYFDGPDDDNTYNQILLLSIVYKFKVKNVYILSNERISEFIIQILQYSSVKNSIKCLQLNELNISDWIEILYLWSECTMLESISIECKKNEDEDDNISRIKAAKETVNLLCCYCKNIDIQFH